MSTDRDHLPAPNCIMPEDFRRLERKVDDLTTALVGNPGIGHRGIVPRLDLVETTVAKIATDRAAEINARRGAMWVVSLVAAIIGALGAVIGTFLKGIFSSS